MNRRSFFNSLGVVVGSLAGLAILPPAKTYERVWKSIAKTNFNPEALINPDYVNAEYEGVFYFKNFFAMFPEGMGVTIRAVKYDITKLTFDLLQFNSEPKE